MVLGAVEGLALLVGVAAELDAGVAVVLVVLGWEGVRGLPSGDLLRLALVVGEFVQVLFGVF